MRHVPVLAQEVIEALQIQSGDNMIDGTLGDAGHTELILEKMGNSGRVLGIDADPEAILRAKHFLHRFGDRAILVRSNFEQMATIVGEKNYEPVNGILLDLGWSSPQFEERGRGFSFLKDEPLDMRFNPNSTEETAADILDTYSEEELRKLFKKYGEEQFAKQIAEAIVLQRKEEPITHSLQLATVVAKVYEKKLGVGRLAKRKTHPATQVFQALRIAVNKELEVLETLLPKAVALLAPGGRLAIITFHSLEDRIVKHFFKSIHGKGATCITKKPIVPTEEEIRRNSRARSAKLRVVEKL